MQTAAVLVVQQNVFHTQNRLSRGVRDQAGASQTSAAKLKHRRCPDFHPHTLLQQRLEILTCLEGVEGTYGDLADPHPARKEAGQTQANAGKRSEMQWALRHT